MSICYVTAFCDIGRGEWKNKFRRSFSQYLSGFLPIFNQIVAYPSQYQLVAFIDNKYSNILHTLASEYTNVMIIPIDQSFLDKRIPAWSRLDRERQIMASAEYQRLVGERLVYPEHHNPRYTLINHAKIDFVRYAIACYSPGEFFAWVDFGYCSNPDKIPRYPLDRSKFDQNMVTYTLINHLDRNDGNIVQTLQTAPERVGGFFFAGTPSALRQYQQLYHDVHKVFQDNNIADDDQHIVLQCFLTRPDLIRLEYVGGWHKALQAFQLSNEPLPSLTEIMNRHGSDKGSGHHNYTTFYDQLFSPWRDKEFNLLEIGIGSINPAIPSHMNQANYRPGASLRGWREYFSRAQIYGCDIDLNILFRDERIETFYLDQTKPEIVAAQIVNKPRIYQIIIDDGLHHFPTNWAVLKQIWSQLASNGIYIIEDIVDFDPTIYNDPFAQTIDLQYIPIPNAANTADNNILVARKKN